MMHCLDNPGADDCILGLGGGVDPRYTTWR